MRQVCACARASSGAGFSDDFPAFSAARTGSCRLEPPLEVRGIGPCQLRGNYPRRNHRALQLLQFSFTILGLRRPVTSLDASSDIDFSNYAFVCLDTMMSISVLV